MSPSRNLSNSVRPTKIATNSAAAAAAAAANSNSPSAAENYYSYPGLQNQMQIKCEDEDPDCADHTNPAEDKVVESLEKRLLGIVINRLPKRNPKTGKKSRKESNNANGAIWYQHIMKTTK